MAKKKQLPKIPTPKRVSLLKTGERYTGSDRNATYGEPGLNMKVQGELQAIIQKYLHPSRRHNDAYHAALNSIAVKLARAIVGPIPGDDTFIDLAAYSAMAGEILNPET